MTRNIIGFRYTLLPYLYSLAAHAADAAEPVLTPAFFYFPADSATYTQDQEFMLGPSLLIAPVLLEGATAQSVYLPAGANWIDYQTDTIYGGGQTITVAAPLDTIPIFVRQGAILPRGPIVQYTGQLANPQLNLDIYPGAHGSFLMYEDDGASMNYTQGQYSYTQLTSDSSGTSETILIQRVAGSWQPPTRSLWITLHQNLSQPTTVELNGSELPVASSKSDLSNMLAGWYFDPVSQQLSVLFADSAVRLTLVVD
jgi:alpha-glucosidase (family GH31 glycosyl hydrolase)